MKKTLLALVMAAGIALPVFAQTNTPPPSIWDTVLSGVGSFTNWAVAPYATYAPDAPQKIGGGILAIYNVNDYVGAATGIDWLGHFNLISVDVTLRLPTRPFAGLGWTNLVATPFIIGGIGTPFSGAGTANGNVSTIEGAGLNVDFLTWKNWNFGAGYAWVSWTGAGEFSGRHHQIFVKISKGF